MKVCGSFAVAGNAGPSLGQSPRAGAAAAHPACEQGRERAAIRGVGREPKVRPPYMRIPVFHADIIRSGASAEELAQAWAWVNADEAHINDGRPLPSGRVAELVPP